MRPMIIVGALLILAGLFVAFNGASFTKEKTVFKAGPVEANVKQEQTIPPWVGAIAVVAGIGCVGLGFRKA